MKIKHNIIFIMKLPVNNTEPFHKTQCVFDFIQDPFITILSRGIIVGFFINFYTAFDNKLLHVTKLISGANIITCDTNVFTKTSLYRAVGRPWKLRNDKLKLDTAKMLITK